MPRALDMTITLTLDEIAQQRRRRSLREARRALRRTVAAASHISLQGLSGAARKEAQRRRKMARRENYYLNTGRTPK